MQTMCSVGTVKPESWSTVKVTKRWLLDRPLHKMTRGWKHRLGPCSITSCVGDTCAWTRAVCCCLNLNQSVSDVVQETDEDSCFTAILQDNPGKPVPECLHSGFNWG